MHNEHAAIYFHNNNVVYLRFFLPQNVIDVQQ